MIFGNLSALSALSRTLDMDQSVARGEMYSGHKGNRALYPASN